jgi:excisionase family DNA binding protein
MTNSQKLLKAVDVAPVLNVSEARVLELARQRLLPSVRLGRQVRFDSQALDEWIAAGGKALPGGWRRDVACTGDAR